jgi:molecular chaperone GrpE
VTLTWLQRGKLEKEMTEEKPEEKQPQELEAPGPEAPEVEIDIEGLKKALDEEQDKAESYLANWQRAQADYANLKRYCQQEKEEIQRLANASLVLSILPVWDDVQRAFAMIPAELEDQPWVAGIKMVFDKLMSTLEAQGLTPIEAIGEPFDPRLHEGIAQGKGKEGIIIKEVEKGYRLNDRVIRPSRVIVGAGEEPEEE